VSCEPETTKASNQNSIYPRFRSNSRMNSTRAVTPSSGNAL
jgi:hypothetical protein